MEVLKSNGNPFEGHSADLVILENNVCESAADAVSVHKVEFMGHEPYNNRQSVFDLICTTLTVPIMQSNLLLFH